MTTATKANQKVVAPKILKGDVISHTEYLEVTGRRGNKLSVKNLHTGMKYNIEGEELIDSHRSADNFSESVKTNMTALARLLTEVGSKVFTVNFETKDTTRTLRGRYVSHEVLLGRSTVEDLDLPKNKRIRLVDHRTINWLIVDGVKYHR